MSWNEYTLWDVKEFNKSVRDAIDNTPFGYLMATAEKHSAYSGKAHGSVIDKNPSEIITELCNQDWIRAYHPNVKSPCELYVPNPESKIKPMVGRVGVAPIGITKNLIGLNGSDGKVIWFSDPKGTGYYSATVSKCEVDFDLGLGTDEILIDNHPVAIIIGPAEKGDGNQVYTFHPGPPLKPSKLTREDAEVLLRQERIILSIAEGGKWSQRPRFEDYMFNHDQAVNMGLTHVLIEYDNLIII